MYLSNCSVGRPRFIEVTSLIMRGFAASERKLALLGRVLIRLRLDLFWMDTALTLSLIELNLKVF